MIKVCIFDMGGVVIRDFQVAGPLMRFLGRAEAGFAHISPKVRDALRKHSSGLIDEAAFWQVYQEVTGEKLPDHEGSLLGLFFNPSLDPPTVAVLEELKATGMRVVCGTNVIDAHFNIHQAHQDYKVFDTVYASHHIQISKPDLGFYTHILEAEKASPAEAFFTDDMEQNVQAASEVGLHAYLYTDANALRTQLRSLGLLPSSPLATD